MLTKRPRTQPKPPLLPQVIGISHTSLVEHLTFDGALTLCRRAVPEWATPRGSQHSFNLLSPCQRCQNAAHRQGWGCTRCSNIVFSVEHRDRGLCVDCKRRRLKPTLPASDRTPTTFSRPAPPTHEPLTCWPGPAERARPSWEDGRPHVYGVAHLDAMLHLQRCLDLLDHHLMAPPHPAPPPIQVGRSWITDGALYSFRHPELGLLGSVCLLGNGYNLQIDIQISGHADDPTSAAREDAFVPIATALSERFYASPMLVPTPGQHIPVITTAPAYRDPQQQKMREYRCARCQALVALLVLADGHIQDALRQAFRPTRERKVPTWVVGLPAADGTAEVVQLWPVRTAAQQLAVEEFNARVEPLRQRHCPESVA